MGAVAATTVRGRAVRLGLLGTLGVVWGLTFPIARLGIVSGTDPFLLVALDGLLAAAVSLPFAVTSREARPPARRLAVSAALGALMIGGINLPLFWGERLATGGAASIVYATSPAISFGWLLLLRHGGPPRAAQIAALAAGLGGVLALSVGAGGGGPVSDPWVLGAFALGAVCQGTGAVLVGRLRPAGEGRWGQTCQFAGAGAVSLVTVATAGALGIVPIRAPVGLAVVGSVLYVGLASMALGYGLFFEMIRRSGPVSANLVTFVNPVVALAAGVVAFGEAFRVPELAGLALVLAALTLLELSGEGYRSSGGLPPAGEGGRPRRALRPHRYPGTRGFLRRT